MWPWGHLAVGTQFPDLVDKPLAYWFSVLPNGRSLTHSYLVAVPLSAIVVSVTRRYGYGAFGTAFAVGYLTHPIADGVGALVDGWFGGLAFLVWPILPPPEYMAEDFGFHWLKLLTALRRLSVERLLADWSDPFVVEVWIGLVVVGLWIYHGMPPLERVVGLVRPNLLRARK